MSISHQSTTTKKIEGLHDVEDPSQLLPSQVMPTQPSWYNASLLAVEEEETEGLQVLQQ